MEMAYQNRFVVCIIKDGTILKELENGSVPIPFGSEYKIRLRNKHNRRAVCKLYIDGENVSGGGFIIGANSHVDIERPADVARKFKFVSLDSEEAYDHGKNGPNFNKIKGVICAEFALEKEYKQAHITLPYRPPYQPPYWDNIRYGKSSSLRSKSIGSSLNERSLGELAFDEPEYKSRGCDSLSLTSGTLDSFTPMNFCGGSASFSASLNNVTVAPLQDGATVEGSHSTQNFHSVYFDNEDNWTTVKLFLQGYNFEDVKQVTVQKEVIKVEVKPDHELQSLENELLELKKLKMKQEIEKLKAELTV
jgi:hypothetical protein